MREKGSYVNRGSFFCVYLYIEVYPSSIIFKIKFIYEKENTSLVYTYNRYTIYI